MPKLKTKKSAKKRFSMTATGKIKRTKAFKRHLLTGKSRSRKRSLRGTGLTSAADFVRTTRMLPYG